MHHHAVIEVEEKRHSTLFRERLHVRTFQISSAFEEKMAFFTRLIAVRLEREPQSFNHNIQRIHIMDSGLKKVLTTVKYSSILVIPSGTFMEKFL